MAPAYTASVNFERFPAPLGLRAKSPFKWVNLGLVDGRQQKPHALSATLPPVFPISGQRNLSSIC